MCKSKSFLGCCRELQGSHSMVRNPNFQIKKGDGEMINRIFQVLMDLVVGIAIYFGLNAFFPDWGTNTVIVVTLSITAVFAEFVEMKLKRIKKGES